MIEIKSFIFSPFAENTYVLYDETKEAIIIDPGCHLAEERETLRHFIESNGLKVVKLLNTHCHIDHVFGNQFVKSTFEVPLLIHPKDLPTLKACQLAAELYQLKPFEPSEPDAWLAEGELIRFGLSTLEVIFVPGHAPGHVAFVSRPQKFTISGDVLFRESIGRTDFPGCNHQDLIESIQKKMFALDDDFRVYSGHGPTTTIGHEKRFNPFLN
ncbi:MAG: MBL fold metallo-hydrolase [Microscillaceae bacterium]|nr:MBL fold metallo-hydrolase [Microscillaceae bacterium]